MKKIVFLIFFSLFVYSKEVLVAAAANTTYAMPEIIKTFNKSHPDIK